MLSKFCFVLAFISLSCSKKEDFSAIKIFGHAGMGINMPSSIYHDNSLEAIELGLTIPGSNGVEIDIQMDKNGRLWVFHDETLNKETDGENCIASNTTEYLKTIRYTSLKNEKLIQLSQVPFHSYHEKLFFLDIKTWDKCSQSSVSIAEFKNALIQLGLPTNCVIILSNPSWISHLTDQFEVYFASDDFDFGKEILAQDPQVKGLIIRNAAVISSQVNEIIDLNKEIYLFEIRSPKGVNDALQKRPSGLISDDLRSAISAVNN